jgi:hypothetical protein
MCLYRPKFSLQGNRKNLVRPPCLNGKTEYFLAILQVEKARRPRLSTRWDVDLSPLDEAPSAELNRGFELNDTIPDRLRGSTSSLDSITNPSVRA